MIVVKYLNGELDIIEDGKVVLTCSESELLMRIKEANKILEKNTQ